MLIFLKNIYLYLDLIITLFVFLIFLLVTIAFFTLGERKLMASIQRRKGPDVVGFWGILQPMADGLKLLIKELIFPIRAATFLFLLGPIIVFILSLLSWIVIPFSFYAVFNNMFLPLLYSFLIASLNIYGLILSGWASNSRYSFLGSIRATAQMISYELIFGMVNIIIVLFSRSFNYIDIINNQYFIWNIIPLFPIFILFLIVMLAETNRTPFDLAEAEAELVAGYNVEYSSILFALFFLGEYANMLILSVLNVIYFWGGWSSGIYLFYFKILIFCIFFIWIRATLPRYRYDQLMMIGWKLLLPISFGLFLFYIGIIVFFNIFYIDISSFVYQQDLLFYKYILYVEY